MLASIPTTYSPQPGQRAYQPHGAALSLLYDRAPEIVLSGPAGTGKSRACLEKLHLCAVKYPKMRGLIIRKTRESLSEAALVTYEDKVLPEYSAIADGPRRNFRQVYTYPNRSQIVVGGLDKPGKVMSTEYDMIYVQEAVELDLADWLALTTRLRNNVMPYQQLVADCNPDAPTHWLWLRAQSGLARMLHSRHEDNPRLFRSGQLTEEGRIYIERLDRLGYLNAETGEVEGTEYQRLRLGLWVQATGLIYGVWSDGPADGNVTEAADYVEGGGSIIWGVDDGYVGRRDGATGQWTADSHPRVFGVYQLRRDGVICRFAESYQAETLSDAHVADALCLPHTYEWVRVAMDADKLAKPLDVIWSARRRDNLRDTFYPLPDYAVVDKSAAELKGRLHAAQIYTRNGPADVEESIKEKRRALALDQNGRRRFLVHPRCKDYRAEMASYRRDPNGRVIKAFDHGPDEGRYVVWTLRHGA